MFHWDPNTNIEEQLKEEEEAADNSKGPKKDIASISSTLLGDNIAGGQKKELLVLCGKELGLKWKQTGKLADERAYCFVELF